MREALAVLSVLLGAVALTVALVVFTRTYDRADRGQDLANSLALLERRLATCEKKLTELAQASAELARNLALARERLDTDPAALAQKRLDEALNENIRKIVKEELEARLKAAAPRTPPATASKTDVLFRRMCESLYAATGASPAQRKKLAAALTEARLKFRDIWTRWKKDPARRDRLMAEARKQLEEKIRAALDEEGKKRFEAWKRSLKDEYSRRFFGLGD